MIRQLRPGERVPDSEPRRYMSSHGYIRLRWKVGKGEYVETYEHRVHDGVVTDAEHVHHFDHVKNNNDPRNLRLLTAEEHLHLHASHAEIPMTEARRLYGRGWSPAKLGERYGLAGWTEPLPNQVRGQHSTVASRLSVAFRGFLLGFRVPHRAHELVIVEQIQLGHRSESTAVRQ